MLSQLQHAPTPYAQPLQPACDAPTLGTGGGSLRHTSVVSWQASELSADRFLPLNRASDRSDRSSSSDTMAHARATVMHSTSHLLGCVGKQQGRHAE